MIGITTLWVHFLTVIVDAKQTFCYNTHMGATRNGRRFAPRFRGHCDPLSIHTTLFMLRIKYKGGDANEYCRFT